MGHLLTSPLPVVQSVDEARTAAAALDAEGFISPLGMPRFFDLHGATPIAVLEDGTVVQAELVGSPYSSGTRVQVAPVLPW